MRSDSVTIDVLRLEADGEPHRRDINALARFAAASCERAACVHRARRLRESQREALRQMQAHVDAQPCSRPSCRSPPRAVRRDALRDEGRPRHRRHQVYA